MMVNSGDDLRLRGPHVIKEEGSAYSIPRTCGYRVQRFRLHFLRFWHQRNQRLGRLPALRRYTVSWHMCSRLSQTVRGSRPLGS